uniref:No apical meristem-associated C-terminal domain-containing protein n=1 Tax=Globisporangium ultimum (strain ATCC 200006 / CBS 805.95 / DAOM BR144) TaxID=431595 RepID=K3WJR2_GLOUD
MGKKTNWTVTEDQTLCRAWLNASETVLTQSADQKATTFWNVVYHLFHAEIDTAVERAHNGLKIRWTRINRDVQKFALIFAHVQTGGVGLTNVTGAVPDAGQGVGIELPSEQQCIEDAKEQFYKEYETKFLFEACWKLLRYSPKWVQLLANSAGLPATSAGSSAPHFLTVDAMPRIDEVPSTTPLAEPSGNFANKRRAATLLESYGRSPIQQLHEVTSALVDEMKRRNELLEEQNAIALFRLETDIVDDDDAREYFELLRRRYVKKMRVAMHGSAAHVHVPAIGTAAQPSALHDVGESVAANAALAADEDKQDEEKDLVDADIV